MPTTTVPAAPFTLKDVSLLIGPTAGTNYEFKTAAESVTFTPTTSSITWTGLGGNTYTDQATATWTVDITYAQDWDTTNSFSRYLHSNEGTTTDIVFKPKSAGTPSVTAKCIITPGAIGGTVNQVATASVTLGLVGKPTVA